MPVITFSREVRSNTRREVKQRHSGSASYMLHYHDQKHFGTCAAVAGNCPANLLITSLSAVSLEKKRKKPKLCTDGFLCRMSGLLSESVPAENQSDRTFDCCSPSTPFVRSLLLGERESAHAHFSRIKSPQTWRREETSALTIWTVERPLFET